MNEDDHPSYPDGQTREYERPEEARLFCRYAAVIRRLRGPDGCPWDRKQTAMSLRRYLVEEAFELVAAINRLESDPERAARGASDELGDVLLVALLISDSIEREVGISLSDVLSLSFEKLVRRHPHVFGDVSADNADQVVRNWNQIKRDVERRTHADRIDDAAGMPALERAHQVQKVAEEFGFDWDAPRPVIGKLNEEIAELEGEIDRIEHAGRSFRDDARIEKELGDVLFTAVNLCRKLKTSPSVALSRSTDAFIERFAYVERESDHRSDRSAETLETLWEAAKRRERGEPS